MKRLKFIFDYLNRKRLTTVAGAWVFFFLTSVVPIAFLILTAFGVFGVSITEDLVSRLPEEFRETGQAIASTAERATRGTTVFFVLSVIISCTTLLNQMSKDGDSLYGILARNKRGIFRRVWAFFALGVLFLAFLALALLFSFGSVLFKDKMAYLSNKLALTILAFALIMLFGYFIIVVLNKFISPVRLKFKQLWLGSLVSLFIIVLGTIAFVIYLRYFKSYNAFYGSLTAIIVFLLWTYIVMLGLVGGVIVNTEVYNSRLRIESKAN